MAYPVVLFCYKRLNCLKQTISCLEQNFLSSETDLIIFSDGPKKSEDQEEVNLVRKYLGDLDSSTFKTFTVLESEENKGLAKSIIGGVSKVLESNDAVIVLEDDLLTTNNFLNFMNQSLVEFKQMDNVNSVSGYTVPQKTPEDYPYDNYFTRRASSWGWGTWKNQWKPVDWSVGDFSAFSKDSAKKKEFNKMGSDMYQMLERQMDGKISSWAIRWLYHQFKYDLFTVYPLVSKVSNIGFGEDATHTSGVSDRFSTPLDTSEKRHFELNHKAELDPQFLKPFVAKYSLQARIYYKIKNILGL